MRKMIARLDTKKVFGGVRNKNTVKIVDSEGGIGSKKAKTIPSPGKVMASVVGNSHSVVLKDYLERGKTITRAYYATYLHLKAEIAENSHIYNI